MYNTDVQIPGPFLDERSGNNKQLQFLGEDSHCSPTDQVFCSLPVCFSITGRAHIAAADLKLEETTVYVFCLTSAVESVYNIYTILWCIPYILWRKRRAGGMETRNVYS